MYGYQTMLLTLIMVNNSCYIHVIYVIVKITNFSVSKSVADALLKYRCTWEDEEPIITEAPLIVDSPKDLIASEIKKTSLLPDSSN